MAFSPGDASGGFFERDEVTSQISFHPYSGEVNLSINSIWSGEMKSCSTDGQAYSKSGGFVLFDLFMKSLIC